MFNILKFIINLYFYSDLSSVSLKIVRRRMFTKRDYFANSFNQIYPISQRYIYIYRQCIID